MKRFPRAIALAAGLLVIPSHIAPVNARSPLESPQLGAHNTFRAEKSGYLEVILPQPAAWKWDVFESTTLRIRGAGRVAGFLLVRQGTRKPQGIYAAAFRVCDRPGCSDGWSGWLTRVVVPIGLKWPKRGTVFKLPAGDYPAYVITDGAPVEVELTLSDVQGSADLEPSERVDASVGVSSAGGQVKNVFTAGTTYKLHSQGVALMGFVERHQNGAAELYNDCLYRGKPSLPEEIAYTPACQADGAEMSQDLGYSVPPLLSSGGSGSYSIRPRMKPGRYSFGGSYVGVQAVRDAAFLSLWVNYD
ncbi:MAG: hypothetical protein ACRDLB_12035 [Actinomycetota bacterium]